MKIQDLIEKAHKRKASPKATRPIVLSTRVRLARNFENAFFPLWANDAMRKSVFEGCAQKLQKLKPLKNSFVFVCKEASDVEKEILVERHLISPELANGPDSGSGAVISSDERFSIMINEEDHLRIQIVLPGEQLDKAWKLINELDDALDEQVNYAYSVNFGYLTACPSNLGTGLRASVMLHLPGLVFAGHIDKVIRACSQLNCAVRGIYGEGSDASGSIFQISNQKALGISEQEILTKLKDIIATIIEQEENARLKLLETHPAKVYDKIGRAFGILRNGYFVNGAEAFNLLSLMRLGLDLKLIPAKYRFMIDTLFIETQPGHMEYQLRGHKQKIERDAFRAELFREKFRCLDKIDFQA